MVRINVGNITSQIVGDLSDFEFGQLRHVVSYEDKLAFMKQRQVGRRYRVPERIFLITEKRRVFRSGLLRLVCTTLENLGVPFEINDLRLSPPADHFMGLSVEDSYFRDYQLEAIKTAIVEKTGMLRIATGGGKTSVICGVVAKLERNTVILVHRIDLLNQVYETLNNLMLYPEIIGRVGSGTYEPNVITVCTVQTICAALGLNYEVRKEEDDKDNTRGAKEHKAEIEKMLLDAQVVCVDEAHHTPARTISEVLERCKSARWRIGFTATDWRDDGSDLLIEAAIGPRIFDRSLSDLVVTGWLVPATVTMFPQAISEPCYSDNWQTIYSHFYTHNDAFNEQVVDQNVILYGANRHILTLVTSVAHGARLAKMHTNVGIPTVFLSGKDTTHYRKKVMDDVRAGRLRHLIGTSIADEGLDLPIIDALNLAGGGKSTTKVYQRIGRALRPYGDKKDAIVIDYRPDNDKLNKHAGRRANIYRKEHAFTFKELKREK